ncbi:hypothetical protein QE152_g32410 [Popillia japonica]|uniref:Uncharacterized protein n=1 Tax=Popillia japonica TaxID=7064 RepID=A0AAW1IZE3_POPJA
MSRGKRLVELALLKFEQEKNKDQSEDIQPIEDDKGRCDGPESDAESEHSLHNTDTDQTVCEENDGNEGVQEQASFDESCELTDGNTDDTFFQNAPIYIGKDKVTKWLKHDPIMKGRTRRLICLV